MIHFVLFILLALLVHPFPVLAKYNPLRTPNNKYGIHIADPNNIHEVPALVNSTGGDWGYVTLVIQDDDRNYEKWQSVFDSMRRGHLIPIVRIATHINGNSWEKPYTDSHKDWARFLSSLNWPIENRYVVLFNEPNHANEWGKDLNPEDFVHTMVRHAKALREAHEDFFILPAGLDVSAATDGKSMDAEVYLRRMLAAEPELFDYLDGWTSHSYPNPEFSGSPYALGRGTLHSYQWELNLLRQLGAKKDLPVFITETGWSHREGVSALQHLLSPQQLGEYLAIAAQNIWSDPQIVAITPFVYSYQGLPFDHFSWKKLGTNDFYPHYFAYQQLTKTRGIPFQRERYSLEHKLIPKTLVAGSTYTITTLMKNEGQGIFSVRDNRYDLKLKTDKAFLAIMDPIPDMEPGQYGSIVLHLVTPQKPETYPYTLAVVKENGSFTVEEGFVHIVPPPAIDISVQLGWRTDNTQSEATVLVYEHDTIIHKVHGVTLKDGKAHIDDLHNVVPNQTYRVVVLVPYYLPRQQILTLHENLTSIEMPRMFPFDFNLDGALTLKDVWAAVKLKPNFISSLFVRP